MEREKILEYVEMHMACVPAHTHTDATNITKVKESIKNVMECRDSRSAKSRKNR